MSEPVSEEFLSQLTEFANALMDGEVIHGAAERGIRGAMISVVIAELRSRRSSDLTPAEVEDLRYVRAFIWQVHDEYNARRTENLTAILDKLTRGGKP